VRPFNNASVIGRALARAATSGLVVPFLTFASALAPAHVHEPGPGHEHEHAVAHSHFAPHHPDEHDHEAGEGPEVEHDDGRVVWIDSPTLHESIHQSAPIPLSVPVTDETVLIERHWSVTPFDPATPLHGPPRAASLLRGPPFSLV
jgi:hypothetical protein